MSQPTFYFPVTVVQDGAISDEVAPLMQTLPLDDNALVAVLAQTAGHQLRGLNVYANASWRFTLPYVELCVAVLSGRAITVHIDPTDAVTAPAGSTVYKNGVLQDSLTIAPGRAIYAVLTSRSAS